MQRARPLVAVNANDASPDGTWNNLSQVQLVPELDPHSDDSVPHAATTISTMAKLANTQTGEKNAKDNKSVRYGC